MTDRQIQKPSEVTEDQGFFDRFADKTTIFVSRAPFFAACLMSVLLWAGSGPFFKFNEPWQLVINTGTTIVTFLMVALLQNSQTRADAAVQHKLNALAEGLADLMCKEPGMEKAVEELRLSVGLEHREST